MSSHALDNQMEERLFKELEEVKKQVRDLRTMQRQGQDAINLQSTGTYTAVTVIPNNAAAIFGFHLNNSEGKIVFSVASISLYEGTVSDEAHLIGGANAIGYGYKWAIWRDWGEANLPGHVYDVSDRVWIENYTGSTKTVTARVEWRYIVNGGIFSVV